MPTRPSYTMTTAAVLWTGGKDSALALHLSLNLYDIRRLICFVPADNRQFYAHPTQLMALQAQKIGIPIEFMPISEPYKQSYRQQIETIKDAGIEVLLRAISLLSVECPIGLTRLLQVWWVSRNRCGSWIGARYWIPSPPINLK